MRDSSNTAILKHHKWNIFVMSASLLLLMASILHRLQWDISAQQYSQSLLIPVEMLAMIMVILAILVNFLIFLKQLIQRNWRKALITAAITVIALLMLMAALAIDAPTLIYMT